MATVDKDGGYDRQFVRNMTESALRISLIGLLLVMAYDIIRPFVIPLVWGGIIAIAAYPITQWLAGRLGGRSGPAAAVVSLVFILALVTPCYLLTDSLLSAAATMAEKVNEGQLDVPPPPEKLTSWPLIGAKLHAQWSLASDNLEVLLAQSQPQLKKLLSRAVTATANGMLGVGMFVISLIIAGGFMAYAEPAAKAAKRLFVRLAGEHQGGDWAAMVVATVRSVLLGVVGVAVLQSILCALGLFTLGVPGAAVWSAVILLLAIAQLPVILVVLPLIIWAYSTQTATVATVFAIWMLLAGLSDNVLKPLLMGRGLDVPMPVILMGAIGGMIAAGIVGLFAGAVVLSIWYKLFREWLMQEAR